MALKLKALAQLCKLLHPIPRFSDLVSLRIFISKTFPHDAETDGLRTKRAELKNKNRTETSKKFDYRGNTVDD